MTLKRNLVYYVCPIASNDEWRRNVRRLRKFLGVFDHKRVVGIAQGLGMVSAAEVIAEFPKGACQFVTFQNDPSLGEVQAFLPLLNRIRSVDVAEITFYAHAKGVSPDRPPKVQANIRRWRNLMYSHCLSSMERVEDAMRAHGCCGCFKKHGDVLPDMHTTWHFSGTFFWFNNRRLFTQAWNVIPRSRYGVEGYLPQFFDFDEAYCLFGDDPPNYRLDLYSSRDWRALERPIYARSDPPGGP